MDDPFHLERFVSAQDMVIDEVRKRSHWMWFVFPQIEGLGHSYMAQKYAIRSLEEARAYLEHAALGPRLVECVELVNASTGLGIRDIFPWPDWMKFRSCMTLFARAASDDTVFRTALARFFEGEEDALTVERLEVAR